MIIAALLASATGFALSFLGERRIIVPLLLYFGAAIAVFATGFAPSWATTAAGVSAVITALAVHWPKRNSHTLAAIIALNAGFWSGALAALTGPSVEWAATLLILIAIPGHWIAAMKAPQAAVILKIVAGWVAAVAILTTALPLLMTAGNQMDHRE
jgi:hypothetical protein